MYYYLFTDCAQCGRGMQGDRFSTQNELDNKIKNKFFDVPNEYKNSELPVYHFGSQLIPDQLYCTYKTLNTYGPDSYGCCHYHVLKSDKISQLSEFDMYRIEVDPLMYDKMFPKIDSEQNEPKQFEKQTTQESWGDTSSWDDLTGEAWSMTPETWNAWSQAAASQDWDNTNQSWNKN